MKVTAALLRRKKACESEVLTFEKLYPNGVDVTEAACVAVADKFDWYWAAHHLLAKTQWYKYYFQFSEIVNEYYYANIELRNSKIGENYQADAQEISARRQAKLASLFGRIAESVK